MRVWLSKGRYLPILLLRLEHAHAPWQARGWRMTGSAFPMHIGRGTLWLRVAPQDTYNYTKLREQKGVRRCIAGTAGG